MNNPQHSSASDSHLTPEYIVEPSRRVLGHFDLDPATSEFANRLIRAGTIYTREDDGLVQPWAGRVFLNPPGGNLRYETCGTKSQQALWWGRLSHAWVAGEVETAIFVGFSLELLQSAQSLTPACPHPLDFPHCVPKKRIPFERDAEEVVGELTAEIAGEKDPKKRRKLEKRFQDTLADLIAGVQRVSGDQPTHANLVVYLPPSRLATASQELVTFRQEFCELGHVGIPY